MIRHLDYNAVDFQQSLSDLLQWSATYSESHELKVRQILESIRQQGDTALIECTARYDRYQVNNAEEFQVTSTEIDAAFKQVNAGQIEALEFAISRIGSYHKKQCASSWLEADIDGNLLGQKVTPLDSVGVYVPGGKAAYPSSVLMNVIPAVIAGVEKVVMVVPAPDGVVNDMVLVAAHLAGATEIFKIGGAQSIAALAYGTETIPKVSKIVGPGNAYVASAKRAVFGTVGIDMIAGPSEVLVLSDGSVPAGWIVMDMFAQAEHDEMAQSIVVTDNGQHADEIQACIDKLLPKQPRKDIIATSLSQRGAIIQVDNPSQMIELTNTIAPEHLEIALEKADTYLDDIRHAGAIFVGKYSAEVFGDYCVGSNHVLPTSGTAKFHSPLGVYDFQKRSSVIQCSREGAEKLSGYAQILANGEGLYAHAASAKLREKIL